MASWRHFWTSLRIRDKKTPQSGAGASALPGIPVHLAVVMDGNGRWARRRGLPRTAGHRAGAENLKRFCRLCGERGIRYLTVYAFSTENWSRPADEVDALMALLIEFFDRYEAEMEREGIRIRFCGDLAALPQPVRTMIDRAESISQNRQRLQLIIALNYGGRREIVQACQRLCRQVSAGRLDPEQIDETVFAGQLYLPDVPDPDLYIRPSGEQRLSNFLLWQAAYAEFWYANVLWPDFADQHLDAALRDFAQRDRRYGGIGKP